MECKEDGQRERLPPAARTKVERKRKAGDASGLRLALATSVPYHFPTQPMLHNQVPIRTADRSAISMLPENIPFMNNMDEITYWVYTKRAPCLLNYDNLIKRREEQPHCSNDKPISVSSDKPVPKKKRKIKLIEEDSLSEKHENVFFGSPRQNEKSGKKSGRSVSLGSNVDFNIKSPQAKRKHKKTKSSHHKANKVVTSTPKNANLRRSTRKKQQNSLDNFNATAVNGNPDTGNKVEDNASDKHVLKKKNAVNGKEKFEDDSDVSGFTAYYIRSTKINSKTTPKSTNKSNKTLLKNNKHSDKEKIVVCVNKSMNTGASKVLNCSSDSSQNIINLVTVKSNELNNKVDRSTSLLKFIDTKGNQEGVSHKKSNKRSRNNLNVSFQSKSSSVSRYPKRRNNVSIRNSDEDNTHNKSSKDLSHAKTRKPRKNTDHEANVDQMVSRTRSGKKIGLDLEISGKTMLMLDSTEPASSSAAVNVAKVSEKSEKNNKSSSKNCKRLTRKQVITQDTESDTSGKKSTDETQDSLVKKATRSGYQLRKSADKSLKKIDNQRDSLRKSGFSACFSESDSDDEPLNQRKFFC